MGKRQGPKVLVLDIETSPIEARVWGIRDQFIGHTRVRKDWTIIAWAAKWLGEPASKIMYRDQRSAKNIADDSRMLRDIHQLMDEADIILTQNGNRFDVKKLNARFILNDFPPPSPFKKLDTCVIAATKFGFTSNKLDYLTDKLCTKYKKLKHKKFPGDELWDECLDGNPEAWAEMEKYNKHDVLALEELYGVLGPWVADMNFGLYIDDAKPVCRQCGSDQLILRGAAYTESGKFHKYQCKSCRGWGRGSQNQLSQEKRQSLLKRIAR
jgi:hypothetical protein